MAQSMAVIASTVVSLPTAVSGPDEPQRGAHGMVILVRRSGRRNPERLQREMEAAFRAFLPRGHAWHGTQPQAWRPALEVFETERALVIVAELAGVRESDLSVVVESGVLTIRGRREQNRSDEPRRYRETGISYGDFQAEIYLPFDVDLDRATADLDNGWLRIELPRTHSTQSAESQPER